MGNYLIKNGRIIDPANNIYESADILIMDGRVKIISPNISAENIGKYEIIDASDKLITPALFDMHVHLREPGGEHKETFETGLNAAVAGGVGYTLAMPNTTPSTDNPEILANNVIKANSLKMGRVYFASHISLNAQGKKLVKIRALKKVGCVALKAFPIEHANEKLFKKALKKAKKYNIPVICHAEIADHPNGEHSMQSEIDAVKKIIDLVKKTGAQVHFAHMSTGEGIEIVNQAKGEGLHVSMEACPHHLFLNEKEFETKKGFARTNPPPRDKANQKSIFQAAIDGKIDVFATDHAPHSIEEKSQDFDKAPPGTTGLETLFATVNTYYLHENLMTVNKAIEMMTVAPAKILNVEIPQIKTEEPVSLAIFDPNKEWTVEGAKLHTKAKSSIFEGMKLIGKATDVIIDGELKLRNEELRKNN